jgi:hypothetical protein
MPGFDGSEKIIGRGAQAVVYLWQGSAYKVYPEQYPKEWIRHELKVQEVVSKLSLPVVQYEPTADPCVIKMDFVDGITLADRIRQEGYKQGMQDMIRLQKQIHQHMDLQLPDLKQYARHDLDHMTIAAAQKDKALACLADIPNRSNLLHFVFHPLNILYAQERYVVIDWINARLGHPVFDFARSYVILNEFANRLSKRYLSLIRQDGDLDLANLHQAIYVMALLRTRERVSEATLKLIHDLEGRI